MRWAVVEGGHLISRGALRRIACDANIIPVVLGTAGQPLDIGRSTRLVPQGSAPRADPARRRLRVPRLRPPTDVVRRPPHRPLGRRRTDLAVQPRPTVRAPPRPRAPRRLDHHHDRRTAVVHPTNMARPRPTTTTKQPLPSTPTRPLKPDVPELRCRVDRRRYARRRRRRRGRSHSVGLRASSRPAR